MSFVWAKDMSYLESLAAIIERSNDHIEIKTEK